MNKYILLAAFTLFHLAAFSQTTRTIKLRVHIFGSNDGELRISVAQADTAIKKLENDFNGTTAFNSLGNINGYPASYFDTRIRFSPEIIVHDNDSLLRASFATLNNLFGSDDYMDAYINFYGDHVATGMIKGRSFSPDCWLGTYYAARYNGSIELITLSHEIGHSLGLPHSCFTCYPDIMIPSTSGWSQPYPEPFQFTPNDSSIMNNFLNSNPQLLINASPMPIYPTADFITMQRAAGVGELVQFTNLSSLNSNQWYWFFGDGGSSTLQNPVHSYSSEGVYNVMLIVESSDGNRDTMIRNNWIHVDPVTLNIPYVQGFDHPDCLIGNDWFVEDQNRLDYLSIKYNSFLYNWNLSNAVGDYFINCSEMVSYTSPSGLPGTEGAIGLDLMNRFNDPWYNNEIFIHTPDFNFTTTTCSPTISFNLSHIPFSSGSSLNCDCSPNYMPASFPCSTVPSSLGNLDTTCISNGCLGMFALGLGLCQEEKLEFQYSISPGIWSTVYSKNRDSLLTVPGETCSFYPFAPMSTDWWRNEKILLPAAVIGQTRVKFRFKYTSGEGTNTLLIDDFRIIAPLEIADFDVSYPNCDQSDGTTNVNLVTESGQLPFTYYWNNGQVTDTISSLAPGNYIVQVTDADGCSVSDSIFLYPLSSIIDMNLGNDLSFCLGDSALLDGTTPGMTNYIWHGAGVEGSANPIIIVNQEDEYVLEGQDSLGCYAMDTVGVSFENVNITVTQVGITLEANSIGALYQWLDCTNNTAIPGEINSIFVPVQNGNYAVIVTENGCTDTSMCFQINNLNTENWDSEFTCFPNPATNYLTLKSNMPLLMKSYQIVNTLGEIVQNGSLLSNTPTIVIGDLSEGVYFLILGLNNEKLYYSKFVKK